MRYTSVLFLYANHKCKSCNKGIKYLNTFSLLCWLDTQEKSIGVCPSGYSSQMQHMDTCLPVRYCIFLFLVLTISTHNCVVTSKTSAVTCSDAFPSPLYHDLGGDTISPGALLVLLLKILMFLPLLVIQCFSKCFYSSLVGFWKLNNNVFFVNKFEYSFNSVNLKALWYTVPFSGVIYCHIVFLKSWELNSDLVCFA